MGREAFSLGLLLATRRAGGRFVFTPLWHQRPLGWSSPAFVEVYGAADRVIAMTKTEADWLRAHGARNDNIRVIPIGLASSAYQAPSISGAARTSRFPGIGSTASRSIVAASSEWALRFSGSGASERWE